MIHICIPFPPKKHHKVGGSTLSWYQVLKRQLLSLQVEPCLPHFPAEKPPVCPSMPVWFPPPVEGQCCNHCGCPFWRVGLDDRKGQWEGLNSPIKSGGFPIKSGGSNRCTPLRSCRACVTSNCHEAHGQGKLRISQQLYSPLYQWNENISTSCSNLLSLLVPFGPFWPLHISTICTLDALQSWVATRSNMNKHLSKCLQAEAMNFQHLQCQHDGIHTRHENPANESHFPYDRRASTHMSKKKTTTILR